jgi:membrane protein YdbS with pleckstrin-like domain
MSWRDRLLHFLRVPHSPHEPPGSPPRVFRAAPNFFKLKLLRWMFTQLLAALALFTTVYFATSKASGMVAWYIVWPFRIAEFFATVILVFQITLGWVIVLLEYELRWYMLSDRAIRIREGITTVREKTIALANIQNIAIRQGPLQRFLGIADVEVNTAGGGGGGSSEEKKKPGAEPMHVAYFRGVDNAEEIRDLLREGVRRQRDAGLGDPDEVVHVSREDEVREAAATLLAEARALRASVSTPPTA